MTQPRRTMRARWRGIGGAVCALLLLLGGCTVKHRPGPAPTPLEPTPYKIAAGDTLDIVVWREDKLSGPVQVRSDGMITVPLLGDVAAAGLAPEALAENIRKGLAHFVDDPNVVVRVAATGNRFFIVGNVRSPGAYELRPDQTFLQALAVAGGFTEFADRDGTRIIRQHGESVRLNPEYDAIVRGTSPDVRLEPNDTIVVP